MKRVAFLRWLLGDEGAAEVLGVKVYELNTLEHYQEQKMESKKESNKKLPRWARY